ncbi:hypothetical protein [Fibrobacter sp. UWB7]|uniref:hypothetical protein n=1 Tax=Fibrobacter sp. UWB7 TaxID=1896206 RepID=UPI00091DE516|nr:hypothetical protein [Fibrobacter sp. UWB7]SHM22626.1 hypothetical protein SAMN05720467_0994 [Fibrobacter sp. UWB7]
MDACNKVALYASYQTGEDLPGYVRFALKHLAETDFKVVLLTNRRTLSSDTYDFLKENHIELFVTENRGFDFGMWRRYLQLQANRTDAAGNYVPGVITRDVERLLLINDSIVYYQNKFKEFFERAEQSNADVVSLTSNDEIAPHLQSFFLYMKPAALGVFFLHIFETPEQTEFYDVTRKLEVGLSEKFTEAEVIMESLYHTKRPVFFAYDELIQQGAGFVKRKLLERRFNYEEKKHFVRHHAYDALNKDYTALILEAGLDADFDESWLPKCNETRAERIKDFIWEKGFQLVGFPAKRLLDKIKK